MMDNSPEWWHVFEQNGDEWDKIASFRMKYHAINFIQREFRGKAREGLEYWDQFESPVPLGSPPMRFKVMAQGKTPKWVE